MISKSTWWNHKKNLPSDYFKVHFHAFFGKKKFWCHRKDSTICEKADCFLLVMEDIWYFYFPDCYMQSCCSKLKNQKVSKYVYPWVVCMIRDSSQCPNLWCCLEKRQLKHYVGHTQYTTLGFSTKGYPFWHLLFSLNSPYQMQGVQNRSSSNGLRDWKSFDCIFVVVVFVFFFLVLVVTPLLKSFKSCKKK